MKTRQCKICKKIKPKTEKHFYKSGGGGNRNGLDINGEPYLTHKCKPCFWNHKKRLPSGRIENRKRLNAYKLKAKCGCGYSKESKNFSTRSLTFHHEHNNKVANISNMMNHSWKKILEEINKCIVICFNCHMAIHHREDKLLDSKLY